MCCVFSTICSKQSSKRSRCFLLCFLGVSWTNQISPFLNSLWSSQTHSYNYITLHMTTKIWEKWFSNVLTIERAYGLIVEFWHFRFVTSCKLWGAPIRSRLIPAQKLQVFGWSTVHRVVTRRQIVVFGIVSPVSLTLFRISSQNQFASCWFLLWLDPVGI